MTTEIDYALMAGASYISTRRAINRFPVPQGWTPFFPVPDPSTPSFPTTDGFEAVSFKKGNEIVISYAGTYDQDYLGDLVANVRLATGNGSSQLLQAAEYYLQVSLVALTGTGEDNFISTDIYFRQPDDTATLADGTTQVSDLYGSSAANIFEGGAGADVLSASSGDDQLWRLWDTRKSRRWQHGEESLQAANEATWRRAA